MDEPLYPSVQGQPVPDLGLAQYGSYHLGRKEPRSSGSSEMDKGLRVATPQTTIYTNSDSTGPVMRPLPELDRLDHDPGIDIPNMGIDPNVPSFDLELANNAPIMTPGELAAPAKTGDVVGPTFSAPDMHTPALKTGDLTAPAIDHVDALEPDPLTGDLLAFTRPGGLDIHAASMANVAPDPMLPDLDEYDRPAGLEMPSSLVADPFLPDLQDPEWEPEVRMSDRPGDLAPGAIGEMDDDPTYKELPDGDYKELYMQQRGRNTRRSRHMGMLDQGLEHEER